MQLCVFFVPTPPALQVPAAAAGLVSLAVPFSYAYTSLRYNFKEA